MDHSARSNRTGEAGSAAAGKTLSALLHTAQALESRIEAALGSVGLSAPRLTVLTELVRSSEPLALSELAARLACVRSNVTQLVDRLEEDGLVRRVADPTDRRSVRAEITPAGRERQELGAARQAEVEAEFAGRLSPEDQAALRRALEALL